MGDLYDSAWRWSAGNRERFQGQGRSAGGVSCQDDRVGLESTPLVRVPNALFPVSGQISSLDHVMLSGRSNDLGLCEL